VTSRDFYWFVAPSPLSKFIVYILKVHRCIHVHIQYALCAKNVTFLYRYNFDIHELILTIFGHKCYWESRQSTDVLFSHLIQLVLHYVTKCKNTKVALFYSNAVLLHRQTSNSHWFNLFSLVTCKSCSCCYLTLYISQSVELSSGLLLGHSSGERKLKALHCSLQQLDCAECKMHRCTVLLGFASWQRYCTALQ